jgi:hypothetical protein
MKLRLRVGFRASTKLHARRVAFSPVPSGIGIDTKTHTLLKALDIGFEQMTATGAARKALIFTESRRTQDYLKTFLDSHGYRGQVVLFNGTNGGPEATAIYERWVEKNRDTGRSSGATHLRGSHWTFTHKR